jgi:NAD(P)-dependent dehydrogenase (short-subunit alcohol dehydrogenase family)
MASLAALRTKVTLGRTAAITLGGAAAVGFGRRTVASSSAAASSSLRLSGKGAIVTGGGTGIGRGVALALAAEGCDVIVTGRRPGPLDETVEAATKQGLAGRVSAFSVDAAEQDQSPLVSHALTTFGGKLDILVNNAGINIPKRSLQDISVEDWRQVIDININGTFHLVHAVLPQMREQQDGLIINITSIAGKRTISTLAGSSYCASKFAMNSLGEAINLEEYEHGIRCTNICPGEVATEILDKRPVPPPPEKRAQMLQPEDIGVAAVMVACLPPRAHVTEIIMTGKTTVEESI